MSCTCQPFNHIRHKRQHIVVVNGDTLLGFLPVCSTQEPLKEKESTGDEEISVYIFISSLTVPLESSFRVTADSEEKERRMRVFYEAEKVVVGTL